MKLKMAHILFKNNLPVFHHSITPYLKQALKPQKMLYIFINLYNFQYAQLWHASQHPKLASFCL